MLRSLQLTVLIGAVLFFANNPCHGEPSGTPSRLAIPTMTKLQLYLAAGDYRRALELLQRQLDDVPSAASYVHLSTSIRPSKPTSNISRRKSDGQQSSNCIST